MRRTWARNISKYEAGYESLATAIVEQAVKDYKLNPSQRPRIEKFFLSDWFVTLTDVDGTIVVERLRRKYG